MTKNVAVAPKTTKAEPALELFSALAMFGDLIQQHAEAVDGRDRRELIEMAQSLDGWRARVTCDAAAATLSAEEWKQLATALAIAGMVTLQTLGGRLARNEGWGGPFAEDGHTPDDDSDQE